MTVCAGPWRGRCHLNCCWMQVLAQTSTSCRSWARQRVKLSRPAQARQQAGGCTRLWTSLKVGPRLHSPLGVRQIFCRMASVAVRYLTEAHWRSFYEIFSLISSLHHTTSVTSSCDPDMLWYLTGLWFQSSFVRETESGAKFAASHKMLFFSEKSLYSEVEESFNVDTENYLVSEQAFTGTAG